jgi:hypothetical protein
MAAERPRDRPGISCITVWDAFSEGFAPVVERLAGR